MIILKIFIAGPRAIKQLDKNIITKLESIYIKNYEVLVGDADGIDAGVQNFFCGKAYSNVTVYASKGLARNNLGNWTIKKVNVEENVSGFEFYAKKDLKMAEDADIGFMIWNGESRGTFNNIINLLKQNKQVILYFTQTQKIYKFEKINQFEEFINSNVKLSTKLKKLLPQKNIKQYVQACLF